MPVAQSKLTQPVIVQHVAPTNMLWYAPCCTIGGAARPRPESVIAIGANLSRTSHLDLDLDFDLDLDVLVLDRFSRASCLRKLISHLKVHVHV